jgi:hypothetical protein
MAKIKPKAKLMVADGAGGLATVEDRRFDTRAWPIEFLIAAKEQADTWLHTSVPNAENEGAAARA